MAISHPQRIFQCIFPQNLEILKKTFLGIKKYLRLQGTAGIQGVDVHIVSFHHLQVQPTKKTRRNNNLDVPGS